MRAYVAQSVCWHFILVSRSQPQHPNSELADGPSAAPSKYFYLRDVLWEHLGAVTSGRIQFWVLKGFLKCVLHMLCLKLLAIKLSHGSASCCLRTVFARTCLTPWLRRHTCPVCPCLRRCWKVGEEAEFCRECSLKKEKKPLHQQV